jgi:hypothetical protein
VTSSGRCRSETVREIPTTYRVPAKGLRLHIQARLNIFAGNMVPVAAHEEMH